MEFIKMSYQDSSENKDLMEVILQSFELHELIPRFKREQIDLECLLLMTENDMEKLIPQLNLRIKFRAKLIAWRMLKGDDLNIFDDLQSEKSINSRESKSFDENVEETLHKGILKENLSLSKNRMYVKDDIVRKKFVNITKDKPFLTTRSIRSSSEHTIEQSLKIAAEHCKSVDALEESAINKNNDDDKIALSKQSWKPSTCRNETDHPKRGDKSYDDVQSVSRKQSKFVTFYNDNDRPRDRQHEMRYDCKDFGHETRHPPKKYKCTDQRDDTLADERYPLTSSNTQKHSKDGVQQRQVIKDLAPNSRLEKRLLSRSDIKIGADAKNRNIVGEQYNDEDSREDSISKKKFKTSASYNESDPVKVTASDLVRKNLLCFRCEKFGHIRKECTEQWISKCFICLNTGHVKRDCPERYESVACSFCLDTGHDTRFCKLRVSKARSTRIN